MAYVVFAEELEDADELRNHKVLTLEQAFAEIAYRCGLPRIHLLFDIPGDAIPAYIPQSPYWRRA